MTKAPDGPRSSTAAVAWFGISAEVTAPDDESLARLIQVVPGVEPTDEDPQLRVWLARAGDGRRGPYSLRIDGDEPIEPIQDLDMAIAIARDLLEHRVAERATEHVFLHAGAVGLEGRAVLLPGGSGSGKTSLTAALVDAGLSYLSDEFAVLGADGLVVPFPRPPAFVTSPGSAKERRPVSSEQMATEALPIRAVAFLEYDARVDGLAIDEISRAEAVFTLLNHALPIRERPRQVVDRLTTALNGTVALKGRRGSTSSAAPALLEYLRNRG